MSSSALQNVACYLGPARLGLPWQFVWERACAAADLDWQIFACEVLPDRLADAVRGLRALGFRGAQLASLHKGMAATLADELSPTAELCAAVSCLHLVGDRWRGDLLEGQAALQEIRTAIDPAGKRAVVLGAGPVAKAIACELARASVARLILANRTAERAEAFVAQLAQLFPSLELAAVPWPSEYEPPGDTELIVHATSLGDGNATTRVPLKLTGLATPPVVLDCVFDPPETRLLREARQRGCVTLSGANVLVNQLALEFSLWTGVTPDVSLMRESLDEFQGI